MGAGEAERGRGGAGRGRAGRGRAGRGEAERARQDGAENNKGQWRRTTRYTDARDGNRSAGTGAKADTDRAGVSARRRTRTGQECPRVGRHGQDRTEQMTV